MLNRLRVPVCMQETCIGLPTQQSRSIDYKAESGKIGEQVCFLGTTGAQGLLYAAYNGVLHCVYHINLCHPDSLAHLNGRYKNNTNVTILTTALKIASK